MTCTTAKGKEFLCLDKIILKDTADISFYFKTKTQKGGKQKVKPFIDGKKWGKKSKTKTKGSFRIVQNSKKVVTTTHQSTGLSFVLTRLKGFFKFDLEVFANVTAGVTGLCQGIIDAPDVTSTDLSATRVSLFILSICVHAVFSFNQSDQGKFVVW